MSTKAGQLLWNRVHVVIAENATSVDVDTGITQADLAFDTSSDNEPPLDTLAPSRLQVVVLPPTAGWANITISEPVVDPTTGTAHVTFTLPNPSETGQEFNVLFWDPHTLIGPGQANFYNPLQ